MYALETMDDTEHNHYLAINSIRMHPKLHILVSWKTMKLYTQRVEHHRLNVASVSIALSAWNTDLLSGI